jgi:hypothetical protein
MNKKTYTIYTSYDAYSKESVEDAKENILYNIFGEEDKTTLTDNFGKEVEVTKEEYLKTLSDDTIYNECSELNNFWYNDAKSELKMADRGENLIGIADLGFWNGRRAGYKEFKSLVDCLSTCDDDLELYVDSNGDLRRHTSNHDASSYVLFRYWKEGLTDRQKENFLDKVYNGNYTKKDITRYTCRAGLEIADNFGWKVRH